MKTKYSIYILFLLISVSLFAGTLQEDRKYEAAVFTAQRVGGFINIPVDEIFAFAYHAATDSWELIPFQIDEQTYGPDPLSFTGKNKWFYFAEIPAQVDTFAQKDHNGVFDDHDELVFMVRDMGDKAPDNSWPDNNEAKIHNRLEICLFESNEPSNKAYIYLFQTSSLEYSSVPNPYDLNYDDNTGTLSSLYYEFGFSQPGLVDNVTLIQNGTHYSVLDRLKARIHAVINMFFPIETTLNENVLISEGLYVTQNPRVRLIRQTSFNFEIAGIIEVDHFFTVDTKFYPFSGTIAGGDTLTPEALEKHMGEGVEMKLQDLRFSWDFNENANGMKFYSKNNSDISIDGNPENIDQSIDVPIDPTENIIIWGLTTGSPGSVFTYGKFANTEWDSVLMYYHDNQSGGQADTYVFNTDDTGDKKSFGDYGVLFRTSVNDTIVFKLDYTLYMMPEQNANRELAEQLVYNIENPPLISRSVTTDITSHEQAMTLYDFSLAQNHPNPFNNSTSIDFNLNKAQTVALSIYNTNGQLVKHLTNNYFQPGKHTVNWDGTSENGLQVPSGVYIYSISNNNQKLYRKLLLVR